MAGFGAPAVDFYSMLSGLGDTIAANRSAQAKRDAFAAATTPGPDGTIDYGKAMLGLAQVDPHAAALMAAAKNHNDTLKQQAIDNARNTSRDATTDRHWSADYGLRKAAAARADDPTPDNYEKLPGGGYRPLPGGPADPAYLESVAAAKARAAAMVPPDGFTKQPDGTYAPLQGGPQDPAYLGRVDAEKARAKGDVPTVMGPNSAIIIPNKAADGPVFTNRPADGGLSDASRDIKARQIINGDYSGLQNIGRGAQAGKTLEAVSNRAAEILMEEQGMSSADAAAHLGKKVQEFKASSMGQGAEARTAGVREANLNLILRAADAAIPAALEASDKVARTGWVPLNQIIQKGEVVSSNPDLKRFGMANLQLAEHWARAMNPTGVMRESDRDKALSFLSTADSQSTYRAAVDQLHTQIVRERDAVKGAPVTPSAPSFRSSEPAQPEAPKVGQLIGGYRYKGGNPADPASWVQSQ